MDITQRKITKIAREAEKLVLLTVREEGVGTAEIDLIHALRHHPGCTQAQLAELLHADKAAIARRTKNLEGKGYLTRQDAPNDRRSQLLFSTEKAENLKSSKAEVEAAFYEYLTGVLTQEEAAALLGRSPSALANKLRLLRLSPDCCRLLTEHDLTERHARALLRLEDEEERLNTLHHIIRQHLNVAQTEQYIDKRLAQLQTTSPSGRRVFLLKDVRLFLNSLDRGLRLVREAGIGAESRREDTEDAILLTIRIPKAAGHPPAP